MKLQNFLIFVAIILVCFFFASCSTAPAPWVDMNGKVATGKLKDYPPDRYKDNAIFVVRTVASGEIEEACGMENVLACRKWWGIIMQNPCEFFGEFYAEIFCHEKGHINGWNKDHSN